jgi:hypothetical protein
LSQIVEFLNGCQRRCPVIYAYHVNDAIKPTGKGDIICSANEMTFVRSSKMGAPFAVYFNWPFKENLDWQLA